MTAVQPPPREKRYFSWPKGIHQWSIDSPAAKVEDKIEVAE